MKELIKRSYQAIRKRGLITDDTLIWEFIAKMKEELKEIEDATDQESKISESVDLANVCICFIEHMGYDFIEEFRKCVEFQETRKD